MVFDTELHHWLVVSVRTTSNHRRKGGNGRQNAVCKVRVTDKQKGGVDYGVILFNGNVHGKVLQSTSLMTFSSSS